VKKYAGYKCDIACFIRPTVEHCALRILILFAQHDVLCLTLSDTNSNVLCKLLLIVNFRVFYNARQT